MNLIVSFLRYMIKLHIEILIGTELNLWNNWNTTDIFMILNLSTINRSPHLYRYFLCFQLKKRSLYVKILIYFSSFISKDLIFYVSLTNKICFKNLFSVFIVTDIKACILMVYCK